MISKGRLVSGFVRGGGQEQLATGVNPAFNRDRSKRAHDLIVAAWSRQGPFRWEGTHYQHRVVNPWAVPLQKPYPGCGSPASSVRRRSSGRRSTAIRTSRSTPRSSGRGKSGRSTTTRRLRPGSGAVRIITASEANPRCRDRGKRRSRNAAQFRWMQASSPASRTRCGAPRRVMAARSTGARSSSSPRAAPRTRAAGRP